MQILFVKKKSQCPLERGPLARGQEGGARGRRCRRPGRGGVDPGSARARSRTAAPGAGWDRGRRKRRRGDFTEKKKKRKAFTGDALRPPDGRRGSSSIKVAAWKEGRSEGGPGTVGRRSRELGRGDSRGERPRVATFWFCCFPVDQFSQALPED